MRRRTRRKPLDAERAREKLFSEKTYAAVWAWLARLGVATGDRRDVAQEVFLAAHQSFHTYDPQRARPERWVNKVAVHVASHHRDRAHRREALTAEYFADLPDEQPGPDELIGAEQARRGVLEVLQRIEPELCSVLVAHDIEEQPMADIAEARGMPVSTAYKRRTRALVAVRDQMGGRP